MKLRFHLSLYNNDNKLKSVCNKIFHKAPTGIRDEMIKFPGKEIRTLKSKCFPSLAKIQNKITKENY